MPTVAGSHSTTPFPCLRISVVPWLACKRDWPSYGSWDGSPAPTAALAAAARTSTLSLASAHLSPPPHLVPLPPLHPHRHPHRVGSMALKCNFLKLDPGGSSLPLAVPPSAVALRALHIENLSLTQTEQQRHCNLKSNKARSMDRSQGRGSLK